MRQDLGQTLTLASRLLSGFLVILSGYAFVRGDVSAAFYMMLLAIFLAVKFG